MRCPKCGKDSDKVLETRMSKDAASVRRRRMCLECSYRFTTYETIIPADIFVVKKDGRREEFKPDKLMAGIKQACWKRQISDEVIDQLVSKVSDLVAEKVNSQYEIKSHTIGELVMAELKELDEVAYVRFASVYRHFKDADAFIDEIHKLPSKSNDGENNG
ncbi:MAG: transcriptional repressor NrdR [Victivallales bacterium]|nr:transcriptional repressor NrdR [Victivallales bacterium]MBR6074074.1 transcriptional repressor NrdR [Victivallales bacterium]MBR6324143.1 transcriptional repressor NrdR [Victivallales bacterium]